MLLRLPRSNPAELFHHMDVLQQNQRFTSMREFVLLEMARLLPDFCSKMTQFVPHGLERQSISGQGSNHLINIVLERTTVSYIAAVQLELRGSVGLKRNSSQEVVQTCHTISPQ